MKRGRHDRRNDYADLGEFERKARKNKRLRKDGAQGYHPAAKGYHAMDESELDDFLDDMEFSDRTNS